MWLLQNNRYFSKLRRLVSKLYSLQTSPKDKKRWSRIWRNFWKKDRKRNSDDETEQDNIFSHEFMEKYNDTIHLLQCLIDNKTYGHDRKLLKRHYKLGHNIQEKMRDIIVSQYDTSENSKVNFGYNPLIDSNTYFSKLKRLLQIINSRLNGVPDDTRYIGFGKTMEKYHDIIHLLKCFINNKTYGNDTKLNKRYTKLALDISEPYKDKKSSSNKYISELMNLIDILQSRRTKNLQSKKHHQKSRRVSI